MVWVIDNLNEKLKALGLRKSELSEDGYWIFYLCIRKAEAMHRLQGFDTAYAYQRAKRETDKFGSWLFLPDLDEDRLDLFTLLYEELSQSSLRQYMRRIETSRMRDVDMVTDLLASFSPDAIEQTTQLLLVLQGMDESDDEKKYRQYVSRAKYCRVQRVLPEPLFREICLWL